jgi:hypothetical protein
MNDNCAGIADRYVLLDYGDNICLVRHAGIRIVVLAFCGLVQYKSVDQQISTCAIPQSSLKLRSLCTLDCGLSQHRRPTLDRDAAGASVWGEGDAENHLARNPRGKGHWRVYDTFRLHNRYLSVLREQVAANPKQPRNHKHWPVHSTHTSEIRCTQSAFWTKNRHSGNNAQRVWCREEQPQILRRFAPQDDSAGDRLFLSTLFGIPGIPGIVGILCILRFCNLRFLNAPFNRALIQNQRAGMERTSRTPR